jgi:DNA polymerase-4
LGLSVSIGVSFNKVFAKLGSDLKKPDAVTVITEDNFRKKIWPLPASELLSSGVPLRKNFKPSMCIPSAS